MAAATGHGRRRITIWVRVASLVAVVVVGGLSFSAARVSASPIVAPALPSWLEGLGTGRPEQDPLQDRLNAVLTQFTSHGGYDKAAADGCVETLRAWHAALAARSAVDNDWHNMNDAFDSLTKAQVSAFALETSSIVQFFANLAAIEATMAGSAALQLKETVPALWSIATNAVVTSANIRNIIASGVANNGKFDLTDLAITLGSYVTGLADAVKGAVGTAVASTATSVLASGKNMKDLVDTIQQAQEDAGASTIAYFEAGNHYSKHLNAYQQAITKLNSAKLLCPDKFNVRFSPNDGTLILYRPVTVSVTVGKGVAPGSYPLTITAGGALSVGLTVVVTTTTGTATGTTSGPPLKGGPCGAFLVLDGSTMHIAAGGSAAAKVFVSEKSSKCVRETSVQGVFSATG